MCHLYCDLVFVRVSQVRVPFLLRIRPLAASALYYYDYARRRWLIRRIARHEPKGKATLRNGVSMPLLYMWGYKSLGHNNRQSLFSNCLNNWTFQNYITTFRQVYMKKRRGTSENNLGETCFCQWLCPGGLWPTHDCTTGGHAGRAFKYIDTVDGIN